MKTALKFSTIFLILTLTIFGCQDEDIDKTAIPITAKEDYNADHNAYYVNLNWKPELDPIDARTILAEIDSSDYKYRELGYDIITPILVHRLYSATDKDTMYHWEPIRKYLTGTEGFSDVEYDQFILKKIEPIILAAKSKPKHTHSFAPFEYYVLKALAIRQCRQLRNGKLPNIELGDSLLGINESAILKYSKLPNTEAIDQLFDKVSKVQILSPIEYSLLDVLISYGSESTYKSLSIVLDTAMLNKVSHYGKRLLLIHLAERAKIDLSKEEQNKFVEFINNKEVYSNHFNDQRHLISIGAITSRITGEDEVACINRLGVYVDNVSEKKPIDEIEKNKEN